MRTDPPSLLLVLGAAQQVTDLHRQLLHAAAWRVLGGRPTDPVAAEAALAGVRALREEALDLLAAAVRALEEELGCPEVPDPDGPG